MNPKLNRFSNLLQRGKTSLIFSTAVAAAALAGGSNDLAQAQAPQADDHLPKHDNHRPDQHVDKPQSTVHNFDVPAGTLADAIQAFEQQAHVKVTMPSQDVTGAPSHGATGVLTAQDALTKILVGTGVAGTFLSEDSVLLKLHGADQDVTVTTEVLSSPKYTAPLRDLPQTLTVIPQSVIQNTASTSLVDVLRTVPGITFGAGEGGNPTGDRPFIRGVDSQSSTYVDNMRDTGSQSREVFDVEGIEIAKGPSGGFVGRGAGGGTINLNSKMARREKFLAVSFSPGTSSFYRGTVDGDVKLAKWVSARMNGMTQDSGVAGRDAVHANRYGFAPSLLFNFGERARLFTNYYQLISNDMPDPGIPYNNPTFTVARTDGIQRVFQTGDGQPLVVNRNAFYGITSRDFRYEKVKTAFGRVELDLWKNTILRNSYRYGKSNQDYLYSQPDDSQGNIYYGLLYRRAIQRNTMVDTSIDQTDLAGTAKTGGIKHTYATGFEFSRERSWNATYTFTVPFYAEANLANPGSPQLLSASRCPLGAGAAGGYFCTDLFHPTYGDPWSGVTSLGVASATSNTPTTYTNTLVKTTTPTKQRTFTGSLYGFDTIQFLPQLLATVGIRYDHYNSVYNGASNCVATATVTCYGNSINDLVNYQGALTYKPKTAISIYGSVSSSATPPGNSLSQGSDPSGLGTVGNTILPPEKNRTEEVGVKWELFGAKALATGAYFQADTENVRITQADGTISTVGKRRNRGMDLGLSGYITRKWQVFGGYTFMNAILVEAGGSGAAAGLQNGRRFPNTPEHSFSITSYYQATHKLSVGGGVYGSGKVYGADNPTTIYTTKWVPAYARVDLFGSYDFNKHLQLQANLQNLGDKVYFLQAYTTHYATMAPGRTAMFGLNVRY